MKKKLLCTALVCFGLLGTGNVWAEDAKKIAPDKDPYTCGRIPFWERAKDTDAVVIASLRKILHETGGVYEVQIVLQGNLIPGDTIVIVDSGGMRGLNHKFLRDPATKETLLVGLTKILPKHVKGLGAYIEDNGKPIPAYWTDKCKNGMTWVSNPVDAKVHQTINDKLWGNP